MEVTVTYTYTELKALLAKSLSRGSIPTSTLSRWMAKLGYEPGQPGRRDERTIDVGAHSAVASGAIGGAPKAYSGSGPGPRTTARIVLAAKQGNFEPFLRLIGGLQG